MNSFDMHQWRAKYFLKENKTVNTSTITKKIATNEGGYDSTEKVGDEYEEAIYQVLLPKIKGLTPVEQEKAVMKVYDEMFDEMEPGTDPYSHVEDWLSKKEGKKDLKEQEELSSRVDRSSIEIGGIDRSDYPDFVDAYIFAAQFKDGTELTDDEMEQLNNEMYDEIHQMVYDQLFEGLTKREKVLKEQVLKVLNESKKNTANQLRSIVKQIIKEERMLNELSPELLQRASEKATEQGRTLQANKFSAAANKQIYKAKQADESAKLEPMKPFNGKELNLYYDIKTERGIAQAVGVNHKINNISIDTDGVMGVGLYTNDEKVSSTKAFFFVPDLDHYKLSDVGFTAQSFQIRGLDQEGAQLLWKLAKAFKPETKVNPNTLVDGVATPIAGKAFQPTKM